MNYLKTVCLNTFVASASIALAQTTFTVDNFRYVNAQNASGATNNLGPYYETTSAGSLDINPDAGFSAPINNQGSGTLDIPLRLSGLDLDSVGTDDDYIDFSVRVTPYEEGAQVVVSNQGIGVKNGTGNVNDNLNPGEALMVEVVDLTVGSSGVAVSGAVTFDGFTSVLFGGGSGSGFGYSTANINGDTVGISLTSTGSYQYVTAEATLSAASSVVIDAITATAIGDAISGGASVGETADKLLSNRLREMSYSFTYDPAGTPSEAVEPTVLTTNDTNIRGGNGANIVYPLVDGSDNGGASTGSIGINPDGGFDRAAIGNTFDVPLRWSGIDLDGDDVADDYFNFTLRAYDANGTGKARLSGPAFGANSGSSWGIDGEESLIFQVTNVELSADAVGSVEFVGFTEATVLVVTTAKDAENNDDLVSSSGSLDVNGTTAFVDLFGLGDGVGYESGNAAVTLTSAFGLNPAQTVTFSNPVLNAGTDAAVDNPSAYARSFDLKFEHDLSGTQAVAPSYEFSNSNYLILNRKTNATSFTAVGSNQQEFVAGAGNSTINLKDGEFFYPYNNADNTIPNANQIDVPLVWNNIDVDGDGVIAAGESLAFTLRYNAGGTATAVVADDGVHVNGNGISNNSIDGDESLIVQILDVVASGISEGAVSFLGFDQINTIMLGSVGGGDSTTGEATIDVNGDTVSGSFDKIDGGYTNVQPAKLFIPTASTLTLDNPTAAEIGSTNTEYSVPNTVVPAVKLRGLKLRFGYAASAVATAIPDTVIDVTHLELRGNIPTDPEAAGSNYAIFPGWDSTAGASIGAVAAQPGLTTADLVAGGNSMSIPLRWTGDLNGDTVDDYIDFDVVVTAGGDGTIYTGGEGIAVNPVYGLNAGEEITYTIENLVVDPAVGGTATSGGFFSGKLIASGGATPETIGTFNAEVGGNSATLDIYELAGGYKNVQQRVSVVPSVEALVFDNFSTADVTAENENTIAPNAHVRGVSFSLNYFEPSEEPETPSTPDTPVVTGSGFVDADTFYIEFTPGGTGYKVTTPTNGGLTFSEGVTDVSTSLAPAGSSDSRFEFDPGTNNFFRIESE